MSSIRKWLLNRLFLLEFIYDCRMDLNFQVKRVNLLKKILTLITTLKYFVLTLWALTMQ